MSLSISHYPKTPPKTPPKAKLIITIDPMDLYASRLTHKHLSSNTRKYPTVPLYPTAPLYPTRVYKYKSKKNRGIGSRSHILRKSPLWRRRRHKSRLHLPRLDRRTNRPFRSLVGRLGSIYRAFILLPGGFDPWNWRRRNRYCFANGAEVKVGA